MPQTAIIIGAGPAGLTAAYELLERTQVKPIVLEMTGDLGGISKTVEYKGNRIDIGGHRFFSKSDWVMNWWQGILPLQTALASDDRLLGRELPLSQAPQPADPEKQDLVMLIRKRLSRIFFLGKFFDYPVTLNGNTLANLGLTRILRIAWSYLLIRLFPIRREKSLEDFFTNRFGRELYLTFFKDYTEKVWGVPCSRIPSEWGAQRVKGLSITKVLWHALRNLVRPDASVGQKSTETTLISQFLYPKLGPGQLWEEVARRIRERGGEIRLRQQVTGLTRDGRRVTGVTGRDPGTGQPFALTGDYVISTMPVPELIRALGEGVPAEIREVSEGLQFRDFVTVGLLVQRLKIKNQTKIRTLHELVPDNWIYIQEREVRLGRLQIFNNWSPYLVADDRLVWLGLEYFCNEGDELWIRSDPEFARFAAAELARINVIAAEDVLDSVVIRMPKTYPCYFGTYDRIKIVQDYADTFPNLFLIGRNGMHRYNNQAHSMLTAKTAVDNIQRGLDTKENLWALNIEEDAFVKKLTAVENLTEGLLRERENFRYNPDTYWQDAGESYTAFPSVRHRRHFIEQALRKFPFTGKSFVFDYGCGLGHVLAALKKRYGLRDDQLGGCDVSAEAVAAARQKLSTPFLYRDFFPKLDRLCDIVICTEVIEHTGQYRQILAWIKQNLAPQGWLILTTQSGKIHASDRYTGHTQHFRLTDLRRLLTDLGFAVTSSRLWGFPLFTLQKYLTDLNFEHVKTGYVEGPLNFRRRLVFDLAYAAFRLQDWIAFGPQIYITARNKPQ